MYKRQTNGSSALVPIVPLLLAAPKYLAGEMTLGGVVQVAAAFVAVQNACNWLFDNFMPVSYTHLDVYKRQRDACASDEATQYRRYHSSHTGCVCFRRGDAVPPLPLVAHAMRVLQTSGTSQSRRCHEIADWSVSEAT